jgi:hydrogenase/urease accessory protein HupE
VTRRLAATAALIAAPLLAHEIGTSRVLATFRDGRYDIRIVTDGTALVEKLQASASEDNDPIADATRLQALLPKYEEGFRKRVKVAFEGVESRPDIAYSVEPAIDANSVPAATVRLVGAVPANASQFTWNFGWTFATYSLMVARGDSPPETLWLGGGQTSKPIPLGLSAGAGRWSTLLQYIALGFTHIVPEGLDHVLFVLGIYLLSRRASAVLWQVSAFTVAHSITLALSMYGIVSVPARIVEPMIAISIAYVAIENLVVSDLRSWRVALVFGFGLLHGLGFAGVLRELGMPRSEFATALVAFNVGVEAGQLAVIGAAALLVGWRFADRAWYRTRVVIPASTAIACVAVYWTFERLVN